MYRQMLIDAKLKSGKRGQKTELTRRSTLRRGGGGEEKEKKKNKKVYRTSAVTC